MYIYFCVPRKTHNTRNNESIQKILRSFQTPKMAFQNLGTVPNKTVLDRYMRLELPEDKCQAMYVWVDGSGENLRSKTRTLNFIPKAPEGEC